MHISGKNKGNTVQEAETVIGEEASCVDFASSDTTRFNSTRISERIMLNINTRLEYVSILSVFINIYLYYFIELSCIAWYFSNV